MPADFKIDYPGTVSDYREKSHEFFNDDYKNEFDYDGDMIDTSFFERLFSSAVAISEKYNVPLYCGEYGVIDKADLNSTVRWFDDINAAFEKYNIPRAVWTYKSKDFGLTDEHYAPVLSEIIKYL